MPVNAGPPSTQDTRANVKRIQNLHQNDAIFRDTCSHRHSAVDSSSYRIARRDPVGVERMAMRCEWRAWLLALGVILLAQQTGWTAPPGPERVAIFPPEPKHNHASCVVETADGSLLAAWYSGSGERKSDDVVIQGRVAPKGEQAMGAAVPDGGYARLSRLQSGPVRRAGPIALALLAHHSRPSMGRCFAEVRTMRQPFGSDWSSEMVVDGRTCTSRPRTSPPRCNARSRL